MAEGNAFDLLDKGLRKLALGRFREPTPIQRDVIPEILNGKNVLVISETGSGKTESCLLPIFNSLASGEKPPITVLYITPLRSLNRDLHQRIVWWSQELGFDVSVRHGDTSQYERSMQAANPPHMMVSTPETLQSILVGKVMREHLKNIRFIVVDEVHELADNKRGVQLSGGLARLLNLIKASGKSEPQIVGLSATVGSPEKVARFLAGDKPIDIINAIKVKELTLKVECPQPSGEDTKIGERLMTSPVLAARLRVIRDYIREKEAVLVFTNTRESAEVLSSRMKVFDKELPVETHHSSLSREVRINAEQDFKDQKLKAMICTSSLELGIDVGAIDSILQYMSPRQTAKLLQRAGRSGHSLHKVSEGIIIANDAEDCFESAIIAKHALTGVLEPSRVYGKSLDVLAHQILGLCLEEYQIPLDRAYTIIKGSSVFSEVTKDEFLETCLFLQKLGYIWVGDKYTESVTLARRKKAWTQYYGNLSTIPDIKNYQIFDIVQNQPVGTLDAEFIALHGFPGTKFIVKGRAWKILEMQERRIIVEPASGIEGAVPAWEGELIPIPFRVAMDVGKLRKEIEEAERPVEYLLDNYPVDKDAAERMVQSIREQKKWGPVPGFREILVESGRMAGTGTRLDYRDSYDYVVVHSCFGSQINDTLGRVVSIQLMNKFGSVGLQADAYRMIFKFPAGTAGAVDEVLRALKELKPGELRALLELTLPNTELFRWRFLHIAKRFGIIERDADIGKAYLSKIIEVYKGAPVYREALHEIWEEKLDVEGAEEVLKDIQGGKFSTIVRPGISPIGKAGLMTRYEIIASARPDKEVFEAFKERLMNTRMKLICCNCGWSITYPVKRVPEKIECVACKAKLVGAVKEYDQDKEILLKKFLKSKDLTKREMEEVNALMDTASMVVSSGRDAVIVLAGRGIGPRTAIRILSRMSKEDELFRDILKEERNYARTKRFWQD